MWLREFSSCSCLTALPGPAWVLLSKTFKPFRPTQSCVTCNSTIMKFVICFMCDPDILINSHLYRHKMNSEFQLCSTDNGAAWCYVDRSNRRCPDLRDSQKYPGIDIYRSCSSMSFIKDHSVITLVLKFKNISVIVFFFTLESFFTQASSGAPTPAPPPPGRTQSAPG